MTATKPSKSALKRQQLALQKLGEELIDLGDAEANSTGAKGLGEPVTIPTAAAVANALARALDISFDTLPVLPERIEQALRAREPGGC